MGRKLKNNNNRFSGWSAYRSSPPEHNTRKRKPKQSIQYFTQETEDAIIEYLNLSNAKLLNLRNFMANEIRRLKEARCKNGQSLFAAA